MSLSGTQYHNKTTLKPLKIFVALHVFLVLIISSHDELWGLPRRVFTLFIVFAFALKVFVFVTTLQKEQNCQFLNVKQSFTFKRLKI